MPRHRTDHSTTAPEEPIWIPPRVGVCAATLDDQQQARAQALAIQAQLRLVALDDADCDLLLMVTERGLELHETGCNAAGGVKVDFGAAGAVGRRLATVSRRQPLALAVGLKRAVPTIVDATAGLGCDAMSLARLGCTVTAIERSVVLGAMFRAALNRAADAPVKGRAHECRITLIVGDAIELLHQMPEAESPDVVYLDPMYPRTGGSALPRKEMRILRRLVGNDKDAGELLDVARRVARKRVVVKRTPRAPPLAPGVTMTYGGKLARYDVYLRQALTTP